MSKKGKKIKIAIGIIIAIVIILGVVMWFVFSRMMPSQAAERDVMEVGYGDSVNIDGFNLWYNLLNEESQNTPIIVIAGGAGLSSQYMETSLEFLAEEHPVLFYDARGCGRSQIKADLSNYSVEKIADECEKVKQYFFGNEKVIILAHSFGGFIAMDYVSRHENSVDSLILVSSVYSEYAPLFTDTVLETGLPPKEPNEANEWYAENIEAFFGDYFYNTDAMKILDNTIVSYATITAVSGSKMDITDQVSGISVPTLILTGGKKEYPLTGLDTAEKLVELFPDSELKQIENSGHFMFAEAEEEFQRIIDEWLD